MAYDITAKRASETAQIELEHADNSPMLDDKGNQLFVTIHGPASKVWQQASAEQNRRRAQRIQKKGRLSDAMEDTRADQIDFLTSITVSFDGWEYPCDAKGGHNAMFRAAYEDDGLGFIRDQVLEKSNNWATFTKGSAKA